MVRRCERCGTSRPVDEFDPRSCEGTGSEGRYCKRCCLVEGINFTETHMLVTAKSGAVVEVPIEKYKRLYMGSDAQRGNWRLNHGGWGIHWPDLDEDLSMLSDL